MALATEALASVVSAKIDWLQEGIPERSDRRVLEWLHRAMLAKIEGMQRAVRGRPPTTMKSPSRGGVSNAEVVLSESDPGWGAEAQREVDALRAVLGSEVEVHHIGSTAVPSLNAKPILDFAIGLPPARFSAAVGGAKISLGRLGYRFVGVRGGLFFEKGPAPVRTHALQIHPAGGDVLAMLLYFRGVLQHDNELRRDYAVTKAAIARCLPRHRWIYAIYKGHWIQERQWRGLGAAGWADWYVAHRQAQAKLAKAIRGGR